MKDLPTGPTGPTGPSGLAAFDATNYFKDSAVCSDSVQLSSEVF